MPSVASSQAFVANRVLLDGRLALFHEREKWLAIADLHFGYELSQRAAGKLIPFWGMDSIEDRLLELLADYQPERLDSPWRSRARPHGSVEALSASSNESARVLRSRCSSPGITIAI